MIKSTKDAAQTKHNLKRRGPEKIGVSTKDLFMLNKGMILDLQWV